VQINLQTKTLPFRQSVTIKNGMAVSANKNTSYDATPSFPAANAGSDWIAILTTGDVSAPQQVHQKNKLLIQQCK